MGKHSQKDTVSKVVTNSLPFALNDFALKAKIDDYAFQQLLFMRDHKPYEIAMMGITKQENPLHVEKFVIVKQKVDAVAADCDPEGMADHLMDNLSRGISAINCERFWAHTHPMQGEGSANPSGKDMATWNHEDNAQKNFFVMFIISKTGQMTCRLRVRGNLTQVIPGLDQKLDIDTPIAVEIVDTTNFAEKIRSYALKYFTEDGLRLLSPKQVADIVLSTNKITDLFPEFLELTNDYDRLVTIPKPIVYGGGHNIGFNSSWTPTGYTGYISSHTNQQKKTATPRDVPDIALMVGEDIDSIVNLDNLQSSVMDRINAKYTDSNGKIIVKLDLNQLGQEYDSDYRSGANNYVMCILGAMRGGLIQTNYGAQGKIRITEWPDMPAKSRASVGANMYWPDLKKVIIDINTAI